MLRASLMSSSGPNVQDTALMAVFCMLVLDIMYADWTSVKANMQGFPASSESQRRHRQPGMVWLVPNVLFLGRTGDGLATSQEVNSMRNLEMPMEDPTYPAHPFNASTCLSISRLPEGLREAALQRELSNEVIAFLEQVQIWTIGPHKAWRRGVDTSTPCLVYEGPKRLSEELAHKCAGRRNPRQVYTTAKRALALYWSGGIYHIC